MEIDININMKIDEANTAAIISYDNAILEALVVALYSDNQLSKMAMNAFAYKVALSPNPEQLMDELWNKIQYIKAEADKHE